MIRRMHWRRCGQTFRFFYMMLLCLNVLRCNLENEWLFLRFQFSSLSAPLPGSLGPSTLWGLWLKHNIRIPPQFSQVFSDYFNPNLQLVLFMIASDYYFHKRFVSRGMVSPAVVLVSRVVSNVMLLIHILVQKVGPLLFHSPTLVLSQVQLILSVCG